MIPIAIATVDYGAVPMKCHTGAEGGPGPAEEPGTPPQAAEKLFELSYILEKAKDARKFFCMNLLGGPGLFSRLRRLQPRDDIS